MYQYEMEDQPLKFTIRGAMASLVPLATPLTYYTQGWPWNKAGLLPHTATIQRLHHKNVVKFKHNLTVLVLLKDLFCDGFCPKRYDLDAPPFRNL